MYFQFNVPSSRFLFIFIFLASSFMCAGAGAVAAARLILLYENARNVHIQSQTSINVHMVV